MRFPTISTLLRPRPARRMLARVRLAVEALEDRSVPAFLAPMTSGGGAWPTHDGVQGVVVSDFNNDGRQDVMVAGGQWLQTTSSNALFVGLGNGDGTFQSPAQLTWKKGLLYEVLLADYNGDGNVDIEFVQYQCDDAGNQTPNATATCFDVWAAASGRGLEKVRSERQKHCY